VNVIAGKDPLEIRAKRTSYAKPITAEQIVRKNGRSTAVRLPSGMVTGWGGLRNFTTITVKNAAGEQVAGYQTDFCPNAYSARSSWAARRPTAPSRCRRSTVSTDRSACPRAPAPARESVPVLASSRPACFEVGHIGPYVCFTPLPFVYAHQTSGEEA
jgi:hypothetical protein